MNISLDNSNLLYVLGALIAGIATITFGTGSSTLSPVTKGALLFLEFLFFLALGMQLERPGDRLSYLLSALSYIVLAIYTSSRFSLSSDQTTLLLLLSAGVFAGMGKIIQANKKFLNRRQTLALIGFLLVTGLFMIGFDISGPQPSYTLNLEEEINFSDQEREKAGKLVIENEFSLHREIEEPDYRACVYPDRDTRANIRIDRRYGSNILVGGQKQEREVEIYVIRRNHGEDDENKSLGSFSLEKRDNCPETSDQKKIVIVREED